MNTQTQKNMLASGPASLPAATVQRGIGKGRQPWRIREYLSGIGKTMTDVARTAETYPQVAQETIRGTRNHRRVLEALETLDCPREYLYGGAA